MSAITLHHLTFSRSTRIFWVLEELGLEYNVKVHHRTAAGRAPEELKKIMPLGSAPVVELNGKILHESSYIITRLLEHASTSKSVSTPPEGVELVPSHDSQYWSAFSEGTLMVWMQAGTIIRGTTKGYAGVAYGGDEGKKGKEALEAYAAWVQQSMIGSASQSHLDFMNEYLTKHDFFSGTAQPGLADFMFLFPLLTIIPAAIAQGSSGPSETPRGKLNIGDGLRAWWKRVESRPALKRALKRQQDEEDASRSRL